MITIKNHNGEIAIQEAVFGNVVGHVVNNCFGVVGMAAASAKDGIVSLLKKENYARGVKVTGEQAMILSQLLGLVIVEQPLA